MSRSRARIVERGRALIGVKFRPQGRSVEQGLDCIGVAMMATRIPVARVRDDYGLCGSDPEEANANFDACGFVRLGLDEAGAGDLLLVRSGPAQLHAVLLTDRGYIHADARLRRVVEVPAPVPWPVLSAWRCPDDGPHVRAPD